MAGTKALSKKDMNGLKIEGLADGTTSTDAATKGQVDTAYTNAISRANHTGTQLSSTVSDFDTQVRTSRLDQMAAPTGPVAFNNQRITTVADPSSAQDAATKNYVDTQLASQANGLAFKGTVRAVSTTNVTISSPGTTIDGLTASNGDVFLLAGQTTGSQNGPYVFNGSSSAMTRATNWDTSGEATLGSFWVVREGSKDNQFAILSNDSAITIGTTTPTFVYVVPGGSTNTGYTTTSPSVSAGGTWTVTHNLGSRYILAQVARVASPYDIVDVRIERTTTNTLSVLPDVAMSSGEFEIMVMKVA